jgi:Amidase
MRVRRGVLLGVLVVAWRATPAYAQWAVMPYLGVNIAGDVEFRRGGPGGSVGYLGSRLGFEFQRYQHFFKDSEISPRDAGALFITPSGPSVLIRELERPDTSSKTAAEKRARLQWGGRVGSGAYRAGSVWRGYVGSIRAPASLCGVVGCKPTPGRWLSDGVAPISHTLDAIGLVARAVEDCELVDAVLTGGTRRSRGASP